MTQNDFLWRRLGPKLYLNAHMGFTSAVVPFRWWIVVVCPMCSVCGDFVFLFCNVVLSILSSFAVIWMRKSDLALLLVLCFLVVVRVLCLFLMVP